MNIEITDAAEPRVGPAQEDSSKDEEHVPKVSMQQLLMDCYEFHGLSDLGVLILFFLFASVYLFVQWGFTAATFKNAVINSMTTYGTNQIDWQAHSLNSIDNMGDAFDFSTGYLQTLWYSTSILKIPDVEVNGVVEIYGNRTLYVSDFAQITYARFLVDLKQNCNMKKETIAFNAFNQSKVECWKSKCKDPSKPQTCSDPDLVNFLQRWSAAGEGKADGIFVLTVFATQPWRVFDYTTQQPVFLDGIDDMNRLLEDMDNGLESGSLLDSNATDVVNYGPVDRRVIYKYGSALKMGLVGSDRLSTRKDAAMFTLTTAIRGRYKRILSFSGTSTIFLKSPGVVGDVFDFLFVLFTLLFIRKEVARCRLSMLQHRSFLQYFSKGWNVWQIVSHICNVIWLVAGWCIKEVKEDPITTDIHYQRLEGRADAYNIWLMCGIIVLLILGISLCRFMRIHVGLNAFYHVLTDSLREIADFLVFVAYIFVLLGSAIFAFFQICGGNSMFIDYGQGVLAMARLMFGFLDFEEFHNYGMGLGRYYWAVTFLFWLSVLFLVLFTFNVLLAIFNLSFERVQKYSIKVEYNFVMLVLMRLAFTVQEAWYLYISLPIRVLLWKEDHDRDAQQLPPRQPASPQQPKGYWHRLKNNFVAYRLHMHEHNMSIVDKFKHKRNSIMFRLNLLFARWCIARLPEMQAVLALYMNFTDLKMIPADQKPQWKWLEKEKKEGDGSAAVVASITGGSAGSSPSRTLMHNQPILRRAKKAYYYGLQYDDSVPTVHEEVTKQQLHSLLKFIHQERHSLGYLHDRFWMRVLIGSNPFNALKRAAIPHLLDAIFKVYDTRLVPRPGTDKDQKHKGEEEDPVKLFMDTTMEAEKKKLVVKWKADEVMKLLHDLAVLQHALAQAQHNGS